MDHKRYEKGPGRWCGTYGGYTNHACRCAPCTEAARLYRQGYMANNIDQIAKHTARRKKRWATLRK